MALTKEHITQLIALQEKDAALDKLQAEIDKIPVEIAALRGGLEQIRKKAAEAKALIIELEKNKKSKELDLAQKEEGVRKHSTDLNQVKTNEAFKALQAEIDRAKTEGSQIETMILEIMEELDKVRKQEKAVAAEVAVEEKGIAAQIAALEAKQADIKGRFDAAMTVREEAATPLPEPVMRLYNHVRSRGKLNAIVPIDGDHCSACSITLAPQVIVEATKAHDLVACESCQRILYRPQIFAAKTA